MADLIKTEDLSFSYGEDRILNSVDFRFQTGDRTALIGANGSGKTTFLHLLVGLLSPDTGRVEAFGRVRRSEEDFHEVRARAGLLFQDPDDQLFCPTVLEDVAFGPTNLGMGPDHARDAARRTLESLGLSGYEQRITYRLSGGEKRLVSLAAVLAMEPEVLLLDEPTAGVDEAIVERIIRILRDRRVSLLVVSHDREFVEEVTDSVLYLQEGRFVRDGEAETMDPTRILHKQTAVIRSQAPNFLKKAPGA